MTSEMRFVKWTKGEGYIITENSLTWSQDSLVEVHNFVIDRANALHAALKEHAMDIWNGYEQCHICNRISSEPGEDKLVHADDCPLAPI